MPIKDKSLYVFGQLGLTGLSVLFTLAAARTLGPRLMGEWQLALLVSTYAPALSLGLVNGLGREIPYNLGKGHPETAREAVATTSRVVLAMVALLLLSIPLASRLPGIESMFLAGITMGLSAARLLNGFSIILLRSYQRFACLGAHQALSAGILGCSILALQWQPSLVVVAVSMIVALSLVSLLAAPFLFLYPVSLATARRLARIGLPIYAAGLIFTLLGSVDRWLVLYFLGIEALGLYTPAIAALGAVVIAPMLVSNFMYPKLAHQYGRSDCLTDLLPRVRRIIWLNLSLTGTVSVLGFVVMYFILIPIYLPSYLPGRTPMAIVFLAGTVLPIGQSFGDLFNVVGMQRLYLRNMAVGFLANVTITASLVGLARWGLAGIAVGTLIGLSVFSALQVATYRKLLAEHTGSANSRAIA